MRSCFSKMKETSLSLYLALEYSAYITPIRINHAIVKTNNRYIALRGASGVSYFITIDAQLQ